MGLLAPPRLQPFGLNPLQGCVRPSLRYIRPGVRLTPLPFQQRRSIRLRRRSADSGWGSFLVMEPGTADFNSRVVVTAMLTLFAGLMSGLTIGLGTLKKTDLAIIERSGTAQQKEHAGIVQGLISDQHRLLVTLLLCNAVAMEAMPLVLDELVSPLAAVVISVTVVLIFGEVLPQAFCKSYALTIGAFTAPIVELLLFFCSPVAMPIGKLLDNVLEDDDGVYTHEALRAVVEIEREALVIGEDEAMVMEGALDLADKTCEHCMTSLARVRSLSIRANIDHSTMDWILQTGHSRIPIKDGGRFVGVLPVRRLIQLRPEDKTPIKALRSMFKPIFTVTLKTKVVDLLRLFKNKNAPLAAVYAHDDSQGESEPGVQAGSALGIITLRDVLEVLISRTS